MRLTIKNKTSSETCSIQSPQKLNKSSFEHEMCCTEDIR